MVTQITMVALISSTCGLIRGSIGGTLNTTNETAFEQYDDLCVCDINKDGRVNFFDMWVARGNMGTVADW